MLRKSGPARALDPCHRPEGSWALGTRMGRQWLPHAWKPHVITVVHLLNSPVLNSMINSCKQYCPCDNAYSYLIFVLYFTVS